MAEFDIVELPPADPVSEGEQAPDFTRPLVNVEFWEDVALSDLLTERPVALVFHPMAGAFPATYIWQELEARSWAEKYDVTVVGCSISSPYEHSRFLDERDADYAIFSDPGNGVSEAYGVENDLDGMAGIEEARPAVFVIDADHTVRYAWAASEWPEFPDYDEIEEAIAELAHIEA